MEALKQIANVAGYSGLYRILKPGRAGVIVETLDDKKSKTMMGPTARVSVLNDISIYVDGDSDEQSIPLAEVLQAIDDKYGDELTVDAKGTNDQLADFMASVVPNYDRERVRVTDIKKLISWYGILRQFAPEVFEKSTEEKQAETTEEPIVAEVPASGEAKEEKPKKTQKA
ncbi:DUF5606 domain-containing protein [Spirosoma sp.]|uniref:DUF5606 family protein n=1 Tax=Spirosoma sp. TaxID=1899569 RepID=UPI003B3A7872